MPGAFSCFGSVVWMGSSCPSPMKKIRPQLRNYGRWIVHLSCWIAKFGAWMCLLLYQITQLACALRLNILCISDTGLLA
jgi:hypothetical protein